jgi:MFS family permease
MGCEAACEPLPLSPEAQTEKHLRHNYVAQSVEGGLFMGANAFLNGQTILPPLFQSLGGTPWIVPLMSIMMGIGFGLPPIFVAHMVDRLTRMHPLCCITGIFQRVPYLLAGGLLLYAALLCPNFGMTDDHGNPLAVPVDAGSRAAMTLALVGVVLAPLICGLSGGVSGGAWQQLFIRTIPARRRSSVTALRYTISSVIGLGAGFVVTYVLASWPGAMGFGILHLIVFVLMAGSWAFFVTIREPNGIPPSHHTDTRFFENLRALPAILRREKTLTRYLLIAGTMNGTNVMMPYMSIYAIDTLHEKVSFVGSLFVAQMLGAIPGNVLAGWLGDRKGGQFVMRIGHALYILLALGASLAASAEAFYAIFFLFGIAVNFQQVGNNTLLFELAPPKQRSTCLAVVSIVSLTMMLLYTGLGYVLWENTGHSFYWLAMATAVAVTVALVSQSLIRDPRKDTLKPAAA